jgi:hypothetical protein
MPDLEERKLVIDLSSLDRHQPGGTRRDCRPHEGGRKGFLRPLDTCRSDLAGDVDANLTLFKKVA